MSVENRRSPGEIFFSPADIAVLSRHSEGVPRQSSPVGGELSISRKMPFSPAGIGFSLPTLRILWRQRGHVHGGRPISGERSVLSGDIGAPPSAFRILPRRSGNFRRERAISGDPFVLLADTGAPSPENSRCPETERKCPRRISQLRGHWRSNLCGERSSGPLPPPSARGATMRRPKPRREEPEPLRRSRDRWR